MSPLPTVSVSTVAATKAEDKAAVKVSVTTVAATAVATGHLALKVDGYSRLKAMHGQNGSYIESSAVEVGGHTWRIRCYLNGNSKENAGRVSLLLYLCSDSDSVVHAEFEFALVRQHGWVMPEHGPQCALIMASKGLHSFGGKGTYSGWPWVIKPKGLEQCGFLKDDCFTVRCTVTVLEERTATEEVVVQADDMGRLMGMLCKCDDDLCKREHARRSGFANFCYSICCGLV